MIVRGTGYVRGAKASQKLAAHIKYVQYRSPNQERPEDRRIFTKDRDEVERHEAHDDIMAHEDKAVAYHKIVLAPAENERENIDDWQQWTRDVMHELEESKGLALDWYAVTHDNTEDQHVHVIVAGRGEDENGEQRTVRMDRTDFATLREAGKEHSQVEHTEMAHDVDRDFREMLRAELEPAHELARIAEPFEH